MTDRDNDTPQRIYPPNVAQAIKNEISRASLAEHERLEYLKPTVTNPIALTNIIRLPSNHGIGKGSA